MTGWGRKARAVAAILRGDAPHSPPVAATAPEPAPVPAPAPCEPVAEVPARETLMGAQLRIVGAQTPAVVLDIGAHHGSAAEYLDNYRIALGPRAGQKVLSLQTVPTREPPLIPVRCVDEQGFSLHAEVCCARR